MLLYSTGKPYNSLSSHTGTNTRSKLFHIEGDPDHPVSRGALCPKGAGSLDYVNSEAVLYILNIVRQVLINGTNFLERCH
ncbi:formate dehydrogenase accessory protein FdhE [Haemophilus influenzae]|uniref:Formate dehydrogenase accessory protein FdhE n=1 Tax=Haemophilus influenzae TaxID=727 RepID=A0A2X1PQP5_HAEIF|nr:formate dehydrogenase accessory protein FdhE [Haemophilus influenzae]